MSQSTKDKQDEKGLFALFKGPSGAGKSVGALSFPNAYVFDHDSKMPSISLKHFPDREVHWDTFKDIFQVSTKIDDFVTNGCPYETLISDSFTNLSLTTLNSIGQCKGESPVDMIRNIKATKGGGKVVEMMSIDYYNGQVNFLQRYWLEQLKLLWAREGNPRNVIVIAHVITKENTDLKTKLVTQTSTIVAGGKAIAAWLPTIFDNMYHFGLMHPDLGSDNQTMQHVCLTDSVGEDPSKCSYNLPSVIDFTNRSLYQEICKYHDFDAATRVAAL